MPVPSRAYGESQLKCVERNAAVLARWIVLRPRGGGHLCAERVQPRPVLFVILSGLVFFAGRDLQPLPVDLHRRLRRQVRDAECRPALHR
jgi:hypothetical protein